MATAAIEPEVIPAGTDLILAIERDHSVALVDEAAYSIWYEKLKADAPTSVDLTTKKGRDVAISYAADVRKKKAAIERDRLRVTKEWRDLTAKVNAAGKVIETQLEALAVEVRAPVTAWEEAEKARLANCRRLIEEMRAFGIISVDDTSETVRDRGNEVFLTLVRPEQFGDLYEEAVSVKDQSIAALKAAMALLTKREEEAAELAKLRAEREARDEADRIAREKAEQEAAAERAAAEAIANKRHFAKALIAHAKECASGFIGGQPQPYAILHRELTTKLPPEITEDLCGDVAGDVEEARVAALSRVEEIHAAGEQRRREAAEKAEAARVEQARQEAAEAAQRDAERKAREEQIGRDRAHAEALAAEKRRADEAERQRQAEVDRIAREEAERAEREANIAHRTAIKTAAKEAIMAHGIPEAKAAKLVMAIIANEIPSVRMHF